MRAGVATIVIGSIELDKPVEHEERKKKGLTFTMTLVSDGNGATCSAGGKLQMASTFVSVSVGSADGTRACDLVRGRRRLGAPAGALDAVGTQVLVQ